MDKDQAVFTDSASEVPSLSAEGADAPRFDEEPQAVPGGFLEALPQFFVFPAILVGTLTVIYLLLRMLAGAEPADAGELLADLRNAGPHGRWQILYSLSDGLRRGSLHLDGVATADLASLYETLPATAETPAQDTLVRQHLLLVLSHKRDPQLTRFALEALESPDGALRRGALQALAVMGDLQSVDALQAVLAGEEADERLLALGALGNVDAAAAAELVAGRFLDADTVLARNAVLLRARAGDERARPFVGRLLDRDAYTGDSALDGGVPGMSEASKAQSRADATEAFLIEACKAAAALGVTEGGGSGLTEPLQKLKQADPSVRVRSAAINALHDMDKGA